MSVFIYIICSGMMLESKDRGTRTSRTRAQTLSLFPSELWISPHVPGNHPQRVRR